MSRRPNGLTPPDAAQSEGAPTCPPTSRGPFVSTPPQAPTPKVSCPRLPPRLRGRPGGGRSLVDRRGALDPSRSCFSPEAAIEKGRRRILFEDFLQLGSTVPPDLL